MKQSVVTRLALPALMASSLLLCLAYWWLGNLPHEISGTGLFVLLGWHIASNRRWFKNMFRGRYNGRRLVTLALHLLLIANMTILLATSVAISKSIVGIGQFPATARLRELHWFSAYWAVIVVGVHLGLHWPRVMTSGRTMLGLPAPGRFQIWALRCAAAFAFCFGIWSFILLGVWTKLTFRYSLDFWDFSASAAPFFGHWAGVATLPTIFTYYLTLWWRARGRAMGSSQSST